MKAQKIFKLICNTFGHKFSFNPSVRESYWRTIHAAHILENWKVACKIVNDYCKRYADLEKEIIEINKISKP